MANVIHINCPSCGGTLGMDAMERVIRCRYCQTWSVVDGVDITPEYYVEPKVGAVEARRLLQRFLTDPDLPAGTLKSARFHSATLFFVPFYEYSARRLGTMIVTEQKRERNHTFDQDRQYSLNYGSSVRPSGYKAERGAPAVEKDTRVVMGDVFRIEPAARLGEWGVEQADIDAIRQNPAGLLKPMRRRSMERSGRVVDATVSPDQIRNRLSGYARTANLEDHTRMEEEKIKLVYYPVWRLKYRYQGRVYGVTVDAVTGKTMAARAPKNDRHRVVWLLAAAALIGMIAGKTIRVAILLAATSAEMSRFIPLEFFFQFIYLMVPVTLFGLSFFLLAAGFAWDQFRYPGEILVRGESRKVIRVNRPEHTRLDRISELVNRSLESFAVRARKWRGESR